MNAAVRTMALAGLLSCAAVASADNRGAVCPLVNAPGVPPEAQQAFRLLVEAEVLRSPTHRVDCAQRCPDADPLGLGTSAGCAVVLQLDVVDLDLLGQRRRSVTAWLTGQSPHRLDVPPDASLEGLLSEAIVHALATDPRAVMADEEALEAALGKEVAAVRGVMSYGVEVAETTLWVGEEATWSPALALRIRRGLGAFHVGGRLRVAFLPVEPGESATPVPTVNAAFEPEFAWFVSPEANTSFYLAGGLGVNVLRFDGRDSEGRSSLVDWGVHLTGRVGVEFLRVADVRADLFASATLPWFVTDHSASKLVDDWTPSVEVGFGVAF